MERTPRLYDTLFGLFSQHRQVWKDLRHLKTFIWMLVGLIQEKNVQLPTWAPYVISRAQQAASTVRRFVRWLNNPRIQVNAIWQPYIRQVLQDWQGRLYLALDTTSLWGKYCWIRVSLIYRGRAIPIAWRIIPHKSVRVAFVVYREVLLKAAQAIPEGIEVVLLADRGFVDVNLMQFLREDLHWHWRLGVKSYFWVRIPGRGWRKVSPLRPERGKAIVYGGVLVTRRNFGPVYLAVGAPLSEKGFWYVLSDEPGPIFQEYGLRTDVEENILDDKSNGFQIESSQIDNAEALNRLILVLAAATLYLVIQGVKVVEEGKRRLVDPHWFRGLSYLKIGWRYVKRALVCGWELVSQLKLPPGDDPEPAMASKRQAQEQRQKVFIKLVKVLP